MSSLMQQGLVSQAILRQRLGLLRPETEIMNTPLKLFHCTYKAVVEGKLQRGENLPQTQQAVGEGGFLLFQLALPLPFGGKAVL